MKITTITEELAECLTHLVHPSKLGVPFDKIMEETKKKVAKQLATQKYKNHRGKKINYKNSGKNANSKI